LGIDSPEDIYVFRKSSVFTKGTQPNVQIEGYDFIREKFITAKELEADPESGEAQIWNIAYNSPILIDKYE
jgi:hypothetical protein